MVIFTFKLVDGGHIKQIVFTEAWQRILLEYRLQFPGELDCDSKISAISSIVSLLFCENVICGVLTLIICCQPKIQFQTDSFSVLQQYSVPVLQ